MTRRSLALLFLLIAVSVLTPSRALAHCDTMSGPVLTAAQQALESGNVNLVLIWVQPADETAIRASFDAARAARKAGGDVATQADHKFFEALVRIHRAGEGAAYEGIKPADTDLGPAVPAADSALQTGSTEAVTRVLHDATSKGVQRHFQKVSEKKHYDPNNLEAGRAYVKAYVEYTHYVEGLYQTAAAASVHHDHASAPSHDHSSSTHDHSSSTHDPSSATRPGPGTHAHAAPALPASDHSAHAMQGHLATDHGGHSDSHKDHLPWLLSGLLGVVVIGESSWMVLRRKRAAR